MPPAGRLDGTGHVVAAAALVAALLAGCAGPLSTDAVRRPSGSPTGAAEGPAARTVTPSRPTPALPRPDHVVVVVMENHGYGSIVGSADAPWINSLPAAVMTDWHGVMHPSQPNYLAMFTGSTHGVTDNRCPVTVPGPSLASQLISAGLSFIGYSEGLPSADPTACRAGAYARKHNPWVDVIGLPASTNQPMTAFPTDYAALPTVSFVVPDLCHDTHDCPVRQGDAWLRDTLDGYVTWAATHNSLLVITYDEDDSKTPGNHIPTHFVGPMVRPGRYDTLGNHYTLLRTVESLYGLPPIGRAAGQAPLTQIWTPASGRPPRDPAGGSLTPR
ncbi:MAG: alkaline phosphatase family protein [Kineosporiaceae bacterium]